MKKIVKKSAKRLPYVVVRTYSAGVHVGELVSQKGPEVVLRKARKIWYWKGANTLNEISVSGVGAGSKVSVESVQTTLTGAIEVLLTTSAAEKNLRSGSWA